MSFWFVELCFCDIAKGKDMYGVPNETIVSSLCMQYLVIGEEFVNMKVWKDKLWKGS